MGEYEAEIIKALWAIKDILWWIALWLFLILLCHN